MKNILAVFHDNDLSSGATKSFLTNVDYINSLKDKFNIIAVIPNKEGGVSDYLQKKNVRVLQYSYGGCVYGKKKVFIKTLYAYVRCCIKQIVSYFSMIKCINCLKKIEFQPDIVYTNTSTINFGYWIADKLNVSHVWHIREFCFDDQNTLRISNRYFAHQLSNSKMNICISKAIQLYYKKKYQMNKSVVLYNDISPNYIIGLDSKIKHEEYNFLITGTLCEKKGQLFVIQVFNRIQRYFTDRKCCLYIAGKMNRYGEYLKKYVKENSIENVIFCGLVEDMNEVRKKIDFSIVASEREAFGRTVIEDMLAGIIVFATKNGAIPELIEHGSTGILYEHRNHDDLLNKIINTLNSKEMLTKIKKEGSVFADSFCRGNTAKEISNIFSEETLCS